MAGAKRFLAWAYPYGTKPRDLILPILIMAFAYLVAAGSWDVLQSQDQDAVIVDFSGRQRMLLEQFHRNWLGRDFDSARSSLMLYRASAKALRFGGTLETLDTPVVYYRVDAIDHPRLARLLDEQTKIADQLLTQADGKDVSAEVNFGLKASSQTVREVVQLFQHRTRNILVLNFAIFVLFTSTGLWLARLMVERRIRLEQVEKLKNEAVRASEAKTLFLANMSHEIRTPLNAIVGMTDILNNTNLSKEQNRYVQTLRRASDTLLALINDILDLSRIESGQMDLNIHVVDLPELLERTCEIMALRAHQKDLEITCYIGPEVPRFVKTDDTRIRQILINLLGNSVKFTQAGEISLRVEAVKQHHKHQITFSVADTGIGIPESKLRTIFDAFTQADSSISTNYGGTGLGLSICRKIVDLFGGTLSVKSQVGTGSTFTFTLSMEAVDESAKEFGGAVNTLAGKRLLVVDDNATNRLIVRKYLADYFANIDEARSGAEGLQHIRNAAASRRPYDVILLDYRMPGINGLDVAKQIKEINNGEGGIVMLLTSDGRRADLASVVSSAGIAEYLFKPIRRNELLNSISNCLEKHHGYENKTQLAKPEEQPKLLHNKRVLIVDDVEDNRFVAKTYLQEEGFSTAEAPSGSDALQMCQEEEFDLILMDIRMSPMDGYVTTEKIRKLECSVSRRPSKIIALTAHAMKEEVEKALASGCDAHLTKPVTRAKIVSAIKELGINTDVSKPKIVPKIEKFLQARFERYLKNIEQELSTIPSLLADEKFESIGKIGHNISGTAGIYDLTELSELAHKVELAAKSKDKAEIKNLDAKINDYLSRVSLIS